MAAALEYAKKKRETDTSFAEMIENSGGLDQWITAQFNPPYSGKGGEEPPYAGDGWGGSEGRCAGCGAVLVLRSPRRSDTVRRMCPTVVRAPWGVCAFCV